MKIRALALLAAPALASAFASVAGCSGAVDAPAGTSEAAVTSVTLGDYALRSSVSGKCLDVSGASTADGAAVQEWDCNGTGAQIFHLADAGGGYVKLVNANSGKAVTASGGQAGAAMVQRTDLGSADQQMQILSASTTEIALRLRSSGSVLDVRSSGTASGTVVQQWAWNGSAAQKWTLAPAGTTGGATSGGTTGGSTTGGTTGGSATGGGTAGSVASACTPQIVIHNNDSGGNGRIFTQNVADPTATLQAITQTICSILYRNTGEIRNIPTVTLYIEAMAGVAYTYHDQNETHLSSNYLAQIQGDVGAEIRGVLTHEFTHIYQNNAGGPGWLIEGMADFVRYKAGLVPLSNRRKGGAYTDAYQTTAFFLSWINDNHADFGHRINQSQASSSWTTGEFQTLTGTNIDTLWGQYQSSL